MDDEDPQGFAGAACGLVTVEPLLLAGWRGWENCVEEGCRASILFRSGVTVRKAGAGLIALAAGVGVDHENEGAGGDLTVCDVEDRAVAGPASQPVSMGLVAPPLPVTLPLTNRSKSSSVAPLVVSNVVPVTPPKAIKSSFSRAVPLMSRATQLS